MKNQFPYQSVSVGHVIGTWLIGAGLGLFLNLFFGLTGLIEVLSGREVVQDFYGYGLFAELCLYGLITPLIEELLFRYLIFHKILRARLSFVPAMVISALLFGVYHWNLLQFFYVLPLGLLFAFAMEKEGSVYPPVRMHGGANVIAVLLTETGIFSYCYDNSALGLLTMLLGLCVSLALMWQFYFKKERV